MTNSKRVLFYSSIENKELFNIQQFYKIDIQLLKDLGCDVILSNRIFDAIKFWNYDFVFAYFYRYSFFVALIAKIFGRDTYFTGGIDALDKDLATKKEFRIQKLFFKMCYLLSKSCIIVSKTDMLNVSSLVKSKKLAYSEHTIDTCQFDCEVCNKENLVTTVAWQASISNVRRKGVDNALRLFSQLIKVPQYSNYKFVIIGKKGDGTVYLENIIKTLGIEKSVVFTDSITELEKVNFLQRSKIYFQLSLYEGFGVAALEALCAKNIVVHSGKGGLSNPIYQDGIHINIDHTIESMFEILINKLSSFDINKLENANRQVVQMYDNNRRREDFERIIFNGNKN